MTFRAFLLATAVLAPGLAAAQPATPLDAIITEATRTPQVAGDVAAPITVQRREEVLRRQPANINDLLRDIPGVEATACRATPSCSRRSAASATTG
jgi:outer membrane cobalamin receptor